MLKLRCEFVIEDISEVSQLICTRADKLVKLDELRHLTVLCGESLLERIILLSDLVVVLPLVLHLAVLVITFWRILLSRWQFAFVFVSRASNDLSFAWDVDLPPG